MVTNNFKKLLTGLFLNIYPSTNILSIKDNITLKTTSNATITWEGRIPSSSTNTAVSNTLQRFNTPVADETSWGTYVKVGTGTTEATADDYNLEAVNSDIICDSIACVITANNKKIYTATFSNPTANDIQVNELGLYIGVAYYYSDRIENGYLLLDRTVLSTPITIPAGQSKAITYEIGF